MATKGYIVLRYTSPQGAPGVYEAWSEAANKIFQDDLPAWKAVGVIGWRNTRDVFGNSPRIQLTYEFGTIEQALEAYASPEFAKGIDNFLKLGTLDFEVSVHRLSREG